KSPDFGRSFRNMTRAFTYVTYHSHISAVPSIEARNSQAHSIGLGAMGLHTYLAQNLIDYGSKTAVDFTIIYYMLRNYRT
ncbi:ribonucleotide-diphosphate reductase subunit alpha, partial [Streptococcus suis]